MESINETVNIEIAYTEATFGVICIQCIKDKGQTDLEFLDAVHTGDRNPMEDNCGEVWKEKGCSSQVFNTDDAELGST